MYAPFLKCTCTPEQRELAFKTIINEKVEMHLNSFDYKTKHLSDSEKMELTLKEIKAFEFVFSDDFLESKHRKPSFYSFLTDRLNFSVWRDFKRNYEKRFGNEFEDFHLESCPTLQPRTNELGETYKPQNPYNKYLHPWFNYAYFFYLRLKDRAKGETIKNLNNTNVLENDSQKNKTNSIEKISNRANQRKIFLSKIKSEYKFHEVISEFEKYGEQIENDIIEKEIPYIFALFEYFDYRNKLENLFDSKTELNEFLAFNLSESLNATDIRKYWKCLDEDAEERNKNPPKYNSFLFLKDIKIKYPKN